MSILITALLAVWMIVALLMILVILMQRPKSEGLGAAFGGGVTENIFGAQTTNVLVKFTGYLAAIFFIVTFALSILYAKQASGNSALRQELMKGQATPQASVAPGAAQSTTALSPVSVSTSPIAAPVASVAPAGSPLPTAAATASAAPAVSASVAPSAEPAASAPPQKAPAQRKKP